MRGAAYSVLAPKPAPVANIGIVNARALFAPRHGAPSALSTPDGIVIAGAVQTARSAYAVVQGPGDTIQTVPIGGAVGTWQLKSLTQTSALLVRGAEQTEVPFGTEQQFHANAAPDEDGE